MLAMAVAGPGISQPPADPPELATWWSPAVEEDKPRCANVIQLAACGIFANVPQWPE